MDTVIQNAVVEAVRRQSWFQRNANTIVAGLGALAGLLGFLATLPLPIKDEYRALIPLAASFLTAFAVKLTRNGVQPSTADKLEQVAQSAPQIDVATIQAEIARTTQPVVEQIDVAQAEVQRWIDTSVNEAIGHAHGVADQVHELAAEYVGQHRGE